MNLNTSVPEPVDKIDFVVVTFNNTSPVCTKTARKFTVTISSLRESFPMGKNNLAILYSTIPRSNKLEDCRECSRIDRDANQTILDFSFPFLSSFTIFSTSFSFHGLH